MTRTSIAVFLTLSIVVAAGAADNPGKCPACSFSAVQQPYEGVRQALIAGRLPAVRVEATRLRAAAEAEAAWAKTAMGRGPELAQPWTNTAASAARIERAASIIHARKAFGQASEAMRVALAVSERDDFLVVYCPVVRLHWLQPKGDLGNPYRPQAPACAEIVKK